MERTGASSRWPTWFRAESVKLQSALRATPRRPGRSADFLMRLRSRPRRRASSIIQPRELGGYRSHLCDFLGAAMAVPSGSGYAAGVGHQLPHSGTLLEPGEVAGRRAAIATSGSSMTAMVISESEYRTALGRFASGVVIVTGSANGQPRGLACQSFFALSLDPPLVAAALARTSASWADIQRSGVFGVNVLRADQVALCRAFGRSGADKFADVAWVVGAAGSPRLRESLAWIECSIEQVHETGDHLLAEGLSR